jgi:hypothetical protein
MLINVAISIGIAVAIFAILALIDGLTLGRIAARAQRRADEYWNRHSLACPLCGKTFETASDASEWWTVCGPGPFGRSFRCDDCREVAVFKYCDDGPPAFEGVESQPRRCCHCGGLFIGKPDAVCPDCGVADHLLVEKVDSPDCDFKAKV